QVVHLARLTERSGGRGEADAVVSSRRGGELDPRLCDLWLAHSDELLALAGGESTWERALAAEPAPTRLVAPSHLEPVVEAFADFVDLKVSPAVGHSRRVSNLAAAAGTRLGLGQEATAELRRAGLVHDLGVVSVPERILGKPGPLTRPEWERVRLHAYYTSRVLTVTPALRELGELAAM